MPAAARVGDMTSHGTPLTPASGSAGSPNVLIGGRPAWRAIADFHACPLTDPKTHTGGAVTKGSANVRINGLAATRQGDLIVESGPANSIAAGFPTVLIGG